MGLVTYPLGMKGIKVMAKRRIVGYWVFAIDWEGIRELVFEGTRRQCQEYVKALQSEGLDGDIEPVYGC